MANIITDNLIQSKPAMDSIERFCDQYVTSSVLSSCGIKKQADIEESKSLEYIVPDELSSAMPEKAEDDNQAPTLAKKICKCIAARKIFIDYMLCFLLNFTIHSLFKIGLYFEDYKRDTLYRFLTIAKARWEALQLKVAGSVIRDIEADSTPNHKNVLIFDDSLYGRAGNGRGTQYCGKVFDHNDRKMRIGYRMMTSVWSNGETTIPVAQTLLTSSDPNLQVGNFEMPDGRTVEGKRARRALAKGTTTVNRMVQEAQSEGIPFDYVLFDTWFSKPAQLVDLKNLGTEVIAMVAKTSTKYKVKDPKTGETKKLNLKEIFTINRKRPGKSRYLLSVNAKISKDNTEIDVKLVFVRNRNNRKDWICFVCTDTDLDENTILLTYAIRWNIEVYFKTVKSYMRLTSECHSTSYDALTAHMVIVAIRYMAFALDVYNSTDTRTIVDLFDQAKREVITDLVNTALVTVIDCIVETIFDVFHPTKEQMAEFYLRFYEKLPNYWKERFKSPAEDAG